MKNYRLIYISFIRILGINMKQSHNKLISSVIVAVFILVGFVAIISLLYFPITYGSISSLMIVMLVFLILLWGMLLILMAKADYHGSGSQGNAIDILKNRYASGEISRKEYLSRLNDISKKA